MQAKLRTILNLIEQSMSLFVSDLKFLFAIRLKKIRSLSGLSQRRLGMAVGLDEFIAGTRINRYEQGIHQPDIGIVHKLAEILNVPVGYFYTRDDFMAEALLLLHRVKADQQAEVLKMLSAMVGAVDSSDGSEPPDSKAN